MDAFTMFKISTVIMILGGIIIEIAQAIKKVELLRSNYLYVLLILAGQWVSILTYAITGSVWWGLLFFIIGMLVMMLILKILAPPIYILKRTLSKMEDKAPGFKITRNIMSLILIMLGSIIIIYTVIKYML